MTTSIKTCFKCGAEKPLTEFYKHKQMADGHLNKCKSCAKRDVKQNREINIERVREYDRLRGSRLTPEYQRKYRKQNPEKRAAHAALGRAIKDGRVQQMPCCTAPGCFSQRGLHAHHTHYDNPLSVVWLCAACHRQLHREYDAKHGATHAQAATARFS